MGNIVLLDDLTINKIAAGEVIERPASVIKEMVENSIDAGAKNITVEIKNGGISFIKVTDDGKGIAKDDLEIAFERHATSKIRSADDLNTVTSMGFRGEALASIAAISNVELVSKTNEQDIGYRVVVEGGDVLEKEEAGCRTGTTITVRNLFFNTPVRYKFLKKDYTESGYVEDVVTRIALVHPEIALKLINTGKTIIQTNGSENIKDVIYAIYGKDIANSVMETEYTYEDIKINGVVGKPEIARSNRSNQLFFVNKRHIKDKSLTAATEQAYKGLIPIGKFGFVILNIEMNPSKVDVNVHPAKLEVRFQEESKVFQAIYHTIKDTLLKEELVSNAEKKDEEKKINRNELSFEERLRIIKENQKERASSNLFAFRKQHERAIEKYNDDESKIKTNVVEDIYKDKQNSNMETTNEVENKETKKTDNIVNPEEVLNKLKEIKNNIEAEIEKSNDEIEHKELTEKLEDIESKYNILEETKKNEEKKNENVENQGKENEEVNETDTNNKFEEIKENVEKLDNNTQAVTEDFNEMYKKLFGKDPIEEVEKIEEKEEKNNAIDLVKNNISIFEEREEFQKPIYKFIGIIFKTYIILEMNNEMYILDQHAAHERIMYERVKKNYYTETTKDSQMLLLPDVITLTHKEMDVAKENINMFRQAGFELEEFGENTIKLTGVPTICLDLDTKELFLETLDEINTVARTAKQEKEEKFIATVACKAAVKANMALTTQEVEKLMDQLLVLPNPFTCPHGRPTVIKMTKYDIERKFARK